jgi:hypothetical protein
MKRFTLVLNAAACAAFALQLNACKASKPKTKGVGDQLRAFIVQDCQSKQKYCQVCAYSGKPTIMAIGDADDKEFENDLVAIQKVLTSSGSQGLTAFALVGPIDKEGLSNFEKSSKALEKLKEMITRRAIKFPVVVLPNEMSEAQRQNYATFAQAYDIKTSRTVLFAEADNRIKFAEVITNTSSTAQFTALASLALKK